jgi:hypothetical protein
MCLYRDVRKPAPGILLATKDPQAQDRLHKRLIKHFADTQQTGIQLLKYSATDKLTLIARGVPFGLDLNTIYSLNLGLVLPGSVERLSRTRDGKLSELDSVVFRTPNEASAQSLIEKGLKVEQLLVHDVTIKVRPPLICFVCGILGHIAARCPKASSYGLQFLEGKASPTFCYKCKTEGHKYFECFAGAQPVCPNCPEGKNSHWPFDPQCSARTKKHIEKATKIHSSWAGVVSHATVEKTQSLEKRMAALEEKTGTLNKNFETHQKAIQQTRRVLREVSEIALKKKKQLSKPAAQHIRNWYEWEQLCEEKEKTPSPAKTPTRRSKRKQNKRQAVVVSDGDESQDSMSEEQ